MSAQELRAKLTTPFYDSEYTFLLWDESQTRALDFEDDCRPEFFENVSARARRLHCARQRRNEIPKEILIYVGEIKDMFLGIACLLRFQSSLTRAFVWEWASFRHRNCCAEGQPVKSNH